MRVYFLAFSILLSACYLFTKRKDAFLQVQKTSESKFYRDYNLFERKGIDEITGIRKVLPYFEVYESSDTTLGLEIHTGDGIRKIAIPKGEQVLYGYCDINDGPPHIFTRFFKDKVVRFRYDENPYHLKEKNDLLLHMVLPSDVEVITKDTLFEYSGYCLIPVEYVDESMDDVINHKVTKDSLDYYGVEPFEVDIEKRCKPVRIFTRDANGTWLLDGNEYEYGSQLPTRFDYWKYYHDITLCFYF